MTEKSQIKNNRIFWIDVDSIHPNPFQPRKEFEEAALQDLADSIRQYGILQPLTITEAGELEDGRNKYELIAGERRLRASKLAGLNRVPAVVRTGDDDKSRFELAIIENLQREDLNPIERAQAFQRLIDEFSMTHAQVGKKMGKSREYVSNTLRLLSLPPEIMDALATRKISEGHTRPLMMLSDRPDEQTTLFKEIMYKKMSVRESEKVARKIAQDKVRKAKHKQDPKIASLEQKFSETLGTRVSIEKGEKGGKIVIDYFSADDLEEILALMREKESQGNPRALLEKHLGKAESVPVATKVMEKKVEANAGQPRTAVVAPELIPEHSSPEKQSMAGVSNQDLRPVEHYVPEETKEESSVAQPEDPAPLPSIDVMEKDSESYQEEQELPVTPVIAPEEPQVKRFQFDQDNPEEPQPETPPVKTSQTPSSNQYLVKDFSI